MSKRNELPPGALAIIETAEAFDLLSLEPRHRGDQPGTFHGIEVLGRMEIARRRPAAR